MGTKAKQKKYLLPLCCVAAVLLIGGAVLLFTQRGPSGGLELDDNATMGALPGIDMEQRQKELQQQLDETMVAFSINSSPVFASGRAEGNLMLENPEHNAKLLVVEIHLDSTDEIIYQTKALPVGSYIENARLDKVLDPGTYPATAYFKAYRESDQSFVGQAGAAITISVLS